MIVTKCNLMWVYFVFDDTKFDVFCFSKKIPVAEEGQALKRWWVACAQRLHFREIASR